MHSEMTSLYNGHFVCKTDSRGDRRPYSMDNMRLQLKNKIGPPCVYLNKMLWVVIRMSARPPYMYLRCISWVFESNTHIRIMQHIVNYTYSVACG